MFHSRRRRPPRPVAADYDAHVEVVPYLGTVVSPCALAIGAMYVIVGQLGHRIDVLAGTVNSRFADVNQRFDDVNRRFDGVDQRFDDLRADMNTRFDAVDNRLGRLETRVDTLIGTVSDLGQRVTRLEVSA